MKSAALCGPLLFFSFLASADPVTFSISANDGSPVFRAVAYLEPLQPQDFPPPKKISVMDQIESQFVPHILPVQRGSLVSFPNSDSIKHHVYSFSPAKTFELQLYKEVKTEPLPFDKAGEVELGCNVHDWMLGYVLVLDTPYFSQTAEDGQITLDVPAGEYKATIWHPRIQDPADALTKTITVAGATQTSFNLTQALLSDLDNFEEDEFTDYE